MEEPRHVKVQKGSEPLGISIVSGENGGIFVSKVTGGSIAHQAGLEYGDQLLEVIVCLLFLWLLICLYKSWNNYLPQKNALWKLVYCEKWQSYSVLW